MRGCVVSNEALLKVPEWVEWKHQMIIAVSICYLCYLSRNETQFGAVMQLLVYAKVSEMIDCNQNDQLFRIFQYHF
ncbi:hypothetical protein FGO68_gene4056 [Halteria grandinella]|uniref:Uncharacterized protein n=1 Tax=Halteria grandinella TaxID=5974 RepID=A0A8J8T056_HALGN|nr:hypothetical protein FGO68_gene4056 [Halteria grandinella]